MIGFEKLRLPREELHEFQETCSAYRAVFGVTEERGPAVYRVLRDLARFCWAHETTMAAAPIDPHTLAAFEGRRQVWLRVQQFLHIPPAELWELRGAPIPLRRVERDDDTMDILRVINE